MEKIMKNNLSDYRAIILDMDGTLYYHLPVKLCMVLSLLTHFAFHLYKIKELFMLNDFRKLREQRTFADDSEFETKQYLHISKKYGVSIETIKTIIAFWMHEYPLKYVRYFRDRKLISLVKQQRQAGVTTIVYSDYPVKEKLDAIGLDVDYQFYSNDATIQCMKPDTKGLIRIVQLTGVKVNETLFIGDRYEKDGICAKTLGMDFVIISGHPLVRNKVCYGRKGLLLPSSRNSF